MESPETGSTAYIREIVNVKQMLVDTYAIWLVFLLAVASFMSVSLVLRIYINFTRGTDKIFEYLKSGSRPLGVIGLVVLILSVIATAVQPLPDVDSLLVYGPFFALGMLLFLMSYGMNVSRDLSYVGIFSLVTGVILLGYVISGYYNLATHDILFFFVFYLLSGISSILLMPMLLVISEPKSSYLEKRFLDLHAGIPAGVKVIILFFSISLLVIGSVSILYVITALA